MSGELLVSAAGVTIGPIEMRSDPRYRILQRCVARPAGRGPQPWRAIAFDVSAGGLGLTAPAEVPEGTLLAVEPYRLPGARPLTVRVVQSRPLESVWLLGCAIVEPLSGSELLVWRSGPLDWADGPQG